MSGASAAVCDGPSEQALLRQQHAQDDLCAASARALSAEADLHYRQRRLYRHNQRLPDFAPHLHPVHGQDDWRSFRAASPMQRCTARCASASP
jgi:cobaltochelatase CobT